jgi:hypothetical protein
VEEDRDETPRFFFGTMKPPDLIGMDENHIFSTYLSHLGYFFSLELQIYL